MVGGSVRSVPHSQDSGAKTLEETLNTTYSDTPIHPVTKGLPKTIESLCPECLKVIDARLFEEEGKVWMDKTCPEHGYVKDLYWSDVELYLKAEEWTFGDGRGLANPVTQANSKCPTNCGICNMHTSHTGCGNLDLTNRCNLTCPICFANANASGYVYEPSYEEVLQMLRNYRNTKPHPTNVIQFAGGEPTIHPRFTDIISAARDMGFNHIQAATNGIKFTDLEFAMKCKEAGLHTLYLQFDGVCEENYRKTRGRSLLEEKLKCLENVRKAGLRIVFVPTIINGINDDQVGPILTTAIENADIISGISYQPVCFTGRISRKERLEKRFTLPDIANRIEEQTGLMTAKDDWYPMALVAPLSKLSSALWGANTLHLSCHAHCTLGTYVIIGPDGDPVPITRFVDVEGLFTEMERLASKTGRTRSKSYQNIKTFNSLKKFFNPKTAPKGMTFKNFLESLYGLVDKDYGRGEKRPKFHSLLVAGMHFMDGYNYEVERVKRCVVHYSAPDGKIYPFCTYNSGPTYREHVEKKFSISTEEWNQRHPHLSVCPTTNK